MSNIPGLSICPDDGEEGEGIEIPSFTGSVTIPTSHRYGNCRTVEDFEKLATIHEGSFGKIYKCKDKRTNEIFALKKFKLPADLQDGIPKAILREINILSTLKHVNIVNSFGPLAGKNIESNYLVMDYCMISLNELFEKEVSAIYEREVVTCIMKQLFQGLEFIHEGLIIHRDINCRNIMFTEEGILKIGGFRTSRFYSKGNMSPGVTELMYRAPELLFQARKYGPAIDMWSSGCLFARLLLKKPLFTGSSELEILSSIFQILGTPSDNIWPGFSEIFSLMDDTRRMIANGKPYSELKSAFSETPITSRDLIQELIVYFPNARLCAKDCLKSSYFKDAPRECSLENFASILKNAVSPAEPMEEAK